MHESRFTAVQRNQYTYTRYLWNLFWVRTDGWRPGRQPDVDGVVDLGFDALSFVRAYAPCHCEMLAGRRDPSDPSVSASAATCRNAEVMGSPRHRTLPAWLTDGREGRPVRDWSVDSPRGSPPPPRTDLAVTGPRDKPPDEVTVRPICDLPAAGAVCVADACLTEIGDVGCCSSNSQQQSPRTSRDNYIVYHGDKHLLLTHMLAFEM